MRLCRERLPAINLAHVDLARGEQCPEQHGSGFSGRQHGLRLDSSLELLVQSFDRIGSSRAPPLARRHRVKGGVHAITLLAGYSGRLVDGI
jgi:hypothetical protein